MAFRSPLVVGLLLGLTGLALTNCEPLQPPPERTNQDKVTDTDNTDIKLPDDPSSQAPPTGFNVYAFAMELHNQPKSGVVDRILPVVRMGAESLPRRRPDGATQYNASYGCYGYKYDRAAIERSNDANGDAGKFTITGLTGGAGVPNPIECERSGSPAAYACNLPRFAASSPFRFDYFAYAPNAPVTKFVNAGDKVSFSASGGADIDPIPATRPVEAPSTNFTVTTDLWSLTAANVDGSQDLVLEFNCGGAPCKLPPWDGQSEPLIETYVFASDGVPSSADPYEFPSPASQAGTVVCDYSTENPDATLSSMTIPKKILGDIIRPSWRVLHVNVSIMNQSVGVSPDNQRTIVGAGHGYFGVSRK